MNKNPEQQILSGEKDVEEICRVNEHNQTQESLSGESDVGESGRVEEQSLEDKTLSGEFRWMSRGIQRSTPTQTGTRAQDQKCQS